jgi:hypothetical protein
MEALEPDPLYLFGSILLKNWTSESYKGEERRRFAGGIHPGQGDPDFSDLGQGTWH